MAVLIYSRIYPKLTQALLDLCVRHSEQFGFIKGSAFHDCVMDYFYGKRFTDTYDTEKLLSEFIAKGILIKAHHCPTQQQLAVVGLGYSRAGYESAVQGSFENMAGLRTHFAYKVDEPKITSSPHQAR